MRRAFCWYRGPVTDTTNTFVFEPLAYEADLYGNITYQHRLTTDNGEFKSTFNGTYHDIRLPDTIRYGHGRDTLVVHFTPPDSLTMLEERTGRIHPYAVAVDAVLLRIQTVEQFSDARRQLRMDSLNAIASIPCLAPCSWHNCDAGPALLAMFDAEQPDGSSKRVALYCAQPLISGFPMATMAKGPHQVDGGHAWRAHHIEYGTSQ